MNIFIKLLFAISSIAVINACGSKGGKDINKPSAVTSSVISSSSSSAAALDLVEFLYPTYNSNLGATSSTELVLKIKDTPETPEKIISVQVGDIVLTEKNGLWVTGENTLDLSSTTLNQAFDVFVISESGTLTSTPLVLNTVSSGVGNTSNVTGLGFDIDSATLFFTNAESGTLYKLVNNTDNVEVYRSQEPPELGADLTYWSMAVDSENDEIYIAADSLTDNSNENHVEIIKLAFDGSSTVFPLDSSLISARSIVLDLEGTIPASYNSSAVYLLDYLSESVLQTRYLSGEFNGLNIQTAGPTGNDETDFSGVFGPKSLLKYDNTLLVSRDFGADDRQVAGSITQVEFEVGPFGPIATYSKFSNFDAASFQKPMAFAFNRDRTALYIADLGRIWEMDITVDGVNKPMKLISSSTVIPQKIGTGPGLGSAISAMEVHPVYDILYVAAGRQGLIAINLETGNRISVSD